MSNVEQVFNDLFIVRQEMRPGWYCSVLVFFGENSIGIVDTGFEETITKMVFPLIEDEGRSLEEIKLVVNTHRDGDHIRGNIPIKENTDALFVAHRLEEEAIPGLDSLLEDGDTVALGDREFKVIHTPGHRPGAICLYDEDAGLLVTDDVVCGTREDLIRMDKKIYIASLERLLLLEAKTMIMAHPFQPTGKNILTGAEIREMLKSSIEIAKNMKKN